MSTLASPKILVREASSSLGDVDFIVSAFDSTLPYLQSIGSGEQWGATPFFEREGFLQETFESVARSEKYAKTRSGQQISVLIAEVECPDGMPDGPHSRVDEDGRRLVAVGTATVRGGGFPEYLMKQKSFDRVEMRDFLYIEVMVTHHRMGLAIKGAGATLMENILKYARNEGKKVLYVDGVSGKFPSRQKC